MRPRTLSFLLLATVAAFLFPTSVAAQSSPTFGPKQYVRGAGPPQTFTETFPRCAGGTCQLLVVNGNPDGSNRVSSASVFLNGARILGPSDFNQKVARLVRSVSLADNDQITVLLNSKPGSFLTVSVECSSFVSLGLANPPGVVSSLWENGTGRSRFRCKTLATPSRARCPSPTYWPEQAFTSDRPHSRIPRTISSPATRSTYSPSSPG